jgi:hypothetical protein
MEGRLELFVGKELASLMEKLLADKADVYRFNATRESLWVRGGALVHQRTNPARVIRDVGEVNINTGGGPAILGDANVEGDFIGRNKIVTSLFAQASAEVKEIEPVGQARSRLKTALQTIQEQVALGETANLEQLEKTLAVFANQDPRIIEALSLAVLHPATQADPAIGALVKDTLAQH